MNAGIIAQAGPPRALYEQPRSEFVAGFMGEAMLFNGQSMDDGTVRVGSLLIVPRTSVPSGAVKVAIRPEAWLVSPAGEGGLDAMVSKHAYLGSHCELTLETQLGPIFVMTSDTSREWAVGDAVTLALDSKGVSVVSA